MQMYSPASSPISVFIFADSVNCFMEEGIGMCTVIHEAWCQELSLGSWTITFGWLVCVLFVRT